MSDGPSTIQDAHYRRGVVLGLTMGEAILLLLFCLLLVLAVPLAQYQKQTLLLSQEIIKVTKEAAEQDISAGKLRELVKELETVAGKRIEDITKEYALTADRARAQDTRLRAVTARMEQLEKSAAGLRQQVERLEAVAEKKIDEVTKEYVGRTESEANRDGRLRDQARAAAAFDQLKEKSIRDPNASRQPEDVARDLGAELAAFHRLKEEISGALGRKVDISDPDKALQAIKEVSSTARSANERERAAAAFEQLKDTSRSGQNLARQPEEVAKDLAKELAAFRKLKDEISGALGRNVDISDPDQALRAMKEVAAAAQKGSMADLDKAALLDRAASAEVKWKDALGQIQVTQRDLANTKGQLENLKRKVGDSGRGVEAPPCWSTPAGRPEYIFDIAATERGMTMRDRKLAHRQSEQAVLPTREIVFESEIATQRFLSVTKPLLDWSVQHDCRFWVRVFDKTADHQKAIYKRQIRSVGDRFYIFEERDEKF